MKKKKMEKDEEEERKKKKILFIQPISFQYIQICFTS